MTVTASQFNVPLEQMQNNIAWLKRAADRGIAARPRISFLAPSGAINPTVGDFEIFDRTLFGFVQCIGPGGGGGRGSNAQGTGGGGGGSGGISEPTLWLPSDFPGGLIPWAIGAAGEGSATGDGGDGGETIFGSDDRTINLPVAFALGGLGGNSVLDAGNGNGGQGWCGGGAGGDNTSGGRTGGAGGHIGRRSPFGDGSSSLSGGTGGSGVYGTAGSPLASVYAAYRLLSTQLAASGVGSALGGAAGTNAGGGGGGGSGHFASDLSDVLGVDLSFLAPENGNAGTGAGGQGGTGGPGFGAGGGGGGGGPLAGTGGRGGDGGGGLIIVVSFIDLEV